jgi:histidinol-phosphate aminotransferase
VIAATGRASEVYTWEPSNSAIARRYGLQPRDVVRFDTNTSPAPPAFLGEILAGQFEPPLNEYPDSEYAELTQAAARYAGVEPGEVIVGAGADEVLDLVAKAFLPAGGAAAIPWPTYAMFRVLTSQRDARAVEVPRLDGSRGFALDLEPLLPVLREVQVVWLCLPNNPTGTADDPAAIDAVLEASLSAPKVPLVVVDEAYHEFVGRTVVPLRERYPNLLAVRTVSKAFALAGIRVGYGIAARETIARLERVRPPGSISTVSATVAAAALRRPDTAARNVARLVEERERLAGGLAAAGWRPYPSTTNFLLVRIGETPDAEAAAARLLQAGIVPRTFDASHPLAGHLRLTVRSAVENNRLLEAIAR